MTYKLSAIRYIGGHEYHDFFSGDMEYLAKFCHSIDQAKQMLTTQTIQDRYDENTIPALYDEKGKQVDLYEK